MKQKENFPRTDLACEGSLPERDEQDPGYTLSERTPRGVGVTELHIKTARAAEEIGRARGRYITVAAGRLWELGESGERRVGTVLSQELRNLAQSLLGCPLSREHTVLVCGLGNEEITADAVGPKTLAHLTVTRHMRELNGEVYRALGSCAVCALRPGVLAQTGIETLELLRGAAARVRPDLVIVIDALAARSCERLAATVQLSDAGLEPGSGIGNTRRPIDRETMGAPVIAMGVPTVIDSSTLVYDALQRGGIEPETVSGELRQVLENGRSFFVSLKESDVITAQVARLLAGALNSALSVEEHIRPVNRIKMR